MTWSERFAAHLEEAKIPRLTAAYQLRVSTSMIHYWIHGATPREKLRERVEKWSKGKVPAALDEDERRRSASTGTDGR